uniref:Putative peptidoglycan binding protein n=1 Tax=viral metagenome TaxID=1070528 RepID=A0A6M3KRQ7_9ZZZZ
MIRRGDTGDEVRELQAALVDAGYGLVVDGVFGAHTERVLIGWQQRHALAPDGIAGPVTLSALTSTWSAPITSVGAWCGRSSLASPERDVAFAVERLRLTDLHVMVNDHSRRRAYAPFGLSVCASQIKALARRATDAGLRVHLTSWIMPFEAYIHGAVEVAMLARDVGAASVQWDAEEPWMHGGDLTHGAAAKLIRRLMPGCTMGVTGIGWASAPKMGPLSAVCDYLVPQCYSTTSSNVRPERTGALAGRWRGLFGGHIIAGLAAYRQHGIAGHTATSAMGAALESVQSAGVSEVIYWSLGHLRRSKECARFVAGIMQ